MNSNTPTSGQSHPENRFGKFVGYALSLAFIVIPFLATPAPEGSSRLVDLIIRGSVVASGLGIAYMTNKHKDSGKPPDVT